MDGMSSLLQLSLFRKEGCGALRANGAGDKNHFPIVR
jgi:hypothetical protein